MKKVFLILVLFVFAGYTALRAQSGKTNVEVINKTGLEKLINERSGRVLFLNLWATWCIPCREEFPDIVKLASEYKKEVDFIGISADYKDEVRTKIIPFLKSNNANFISYVSGFKNDEALINALDKNWNGALPATFIYDINGNKLTLLEGKKSLEEFKAEIEKAINLKK